MNDAKIRKQLRGADRQGPQAVVQVISNTRFNQPATDFSATVRALRAAAPKQAPLLFALGPRNFRELVWSRQALKAMPLERELEWAYCWLRNQSTRLNEFRQFSIHIQNLVISGDLLQAKQSLDDFIRGKGWSLWAAELRCALEQLACGTESQKQWTSALQATTFNSIPGLLLQVFSDRNDATFSHDAFYSRCLDSFPRFSSIGDWVPHYLFHRVLGHVGEPRITLPSVLARDISSSLIDYYESLVDTLSQITLDSSLKSLRPLACKIALNLVEDGYNDHRLEKLAITLGGKHPGAFPHISHGSANLLEDLRLAICGCESKVGNVIYKHPLNLILGQVRDCQNGGMTADKAIGDLLKLGVNLKGLDVGLGVALCTQQATSNLSTEPVVPFGITLLSPRFNLEDVAALEEDTAPNLLAWISQEHSDSKTRKTAELLKHILEGDEVSDATDIPYVVRIWLAHKLILQKRYKEVHRLLGVENYGGQWLRHSEKLRILAHLGEGNLAAALNHASSWLLKDPRYAFEFPMSDIFQNREWSNFRDLDPVLVGIVAHHAHTALGDHKTGYICKMACRTFVLSGARNALPDSYSGLSDANEMALYVAFLRDVWVEENLSMNHFLATTDDVRQDRMQILQMLLQWDAENEPQHVEAIKELTLKERLRQGLIRIDKTRVYVNEPVITRWAEKELSQHYERSRSLSQSSNDSKLVDDFLRQYAVDPSNTELLNVFSNGQPTAADGILIDLLNRLYRRFLLDPNDGLDCYLSVRIRHGSLRGTLFGALEEQGLLYSASGFSKTVFEDRWGGSLCLNGAVRAEVLALMEEFTVKLRAIVDELVNERVQIRSSEKPLGAINPYLPPMFGRLLSSELADRPMSFPTFIYNCYFIFWKAIEIGLNEISSFIRNEMSSRLQDEFNSLIAALRNYGARTLPLVTVLTTVATTTHSQCEVVSDWFHPPGQDDDEKYTLQEAIEIAKTATKNVYRAFPAELNICSIPEDELPLSTAGLSVLSDCLFVIFENSWKHSGLGEGIGTLDIAVTFDPATKLLALTVLSDLSPNVRQRLENGELVHLHGRHLNELSPDLARREGGSGFAKLARSVRMVDRTLCERPMDFGLQAGRWYTTVTIPLYEREGVYEAGE